MREKEKASVSSQKPFTSSSSTANSTTSSLSKHEEVSKKNSTVSTTSSKLAEDQLLRRPTGLSEKQHSSNKGYKVATLMGQDWFSAQLGPVVVS